MTASRPRTDAAGPTGRSDSPALRPGVELVSAGTGAFLLDRQAGRVHALNETAAAVVARFDGSTSIGAVAADLAGTYGVEPATVEADLAVVMDQLTAEALLEGGTPVPATVLPVPGYPVRSSALARRAERLLDQVPWPHHLGPYRSLDAAFQVRVDDDGLAGYLERTLAPLADPAAASVAGLHTYRIASPARTGRRWRVWVDASRVVESKGVATAAEHVLWHVNRLAVLTTGGSPVLHAAGVVGPDGAALLPAAANAGKSTLAAGLVASGLGYLSDEAIAVELPDRLRPFPKAISLDRGSWPLFPDVEIVASDEPYELHRRHLPAGRFGPSPPVSPTKLRWIVCPRYEPGAALRVERVGAETVFPLILEQCFHLGTAPDVVPQLVALIESCETWQLVSSDLDEAVGAVRSIMGCPASLP